MILKNLESLPRIGGVFKGLINLPLILDFVIILSTMKQAALHGARQRHGERRNLDRLAVDGSR
jgi:hypothetical protein